LVLRGQKDETNITGAQVNATTTGRRKNSRRKKNTDLQSVKSLSKKWGRFLRVDPSRKGVGGIERTMGHRL